MRPKTLVAIVLVSWVVTTAGTALVLAQTPPMQEKSKSVKTAPPIKVTFKSPTIGDKPTLTLIIGSKLPGVVRVVRVGTSEPQQRILISFIRERDRALAGQFTAERKQVGPDTFEYQAELTAPPGAGKYELVATLDKAQLPDPKPSASIKVEVIK